MQKRECAYCNASTILTKEHLLPECLSKKAGTILEANVGSGTTQRVIASDPVIRDVCNSCNNGPLSVLDEYVCGAYDKYFAHLVRPGGRVEFNLEFDLLLRWLLKTGYNAARARKWSTSLAQVRRYILGLNGDPPASRILLQLVTPTTVAQDDIADFPRGTEVPPTFHRLAIMDASLFPGFSTIFLLTLNSYYFYVLLEDRKVPRRIRTKSYKALLRHVPGACKLTPGKRCIIYASSLNATEAEMQSEARIRNVLQWVRWRGN